MQYPVPQFTDVEDKIIGSLTLIQFGIIFGAGIVVFLAYSATKSMSVLIGFSLVFGLPAIILAFAKPFGRPLYKTIPYIIKFMFGPKVLVFHKDANYLTGQSKFKSAQTASETTEHPAEAGDPRKKLQEVNSMLEKQSEQEKELISQLK